MHDSSAYHDRLGLSLAGFMDNTQTLVSMQPDNWQFVVCDYVRRLTSELERVRPIIEAARAHRDVEDRHYGSLTRADGVLYAAVDSWESVRTTIPKGRSTGFTKENSDAPR